SDLIWVINPMNDNFLRVMEKIREYAAELLEPIDIKLEFQNIEEGELIKLNPEERKNIYFIAKEAINNAVKYSRAKQISVTFIKKIDAIEVEISDDGIGFQPHTVVSGNGLKNMKERAAEISAELEIKSGQGTQIRLTLSTNIAWDYNL
ncbi:MAG TPA: ATP-binding protein, partial [Brumimicrobium sp.]|nr:ATP-binding protein [Brumimicrobium sp.]